MLWYVCAKSFITEFYCVSREYTFQTHFGFFNIRSTRSITLRDISYYPLKQERCCRARTVAVVVHKIHDTFGRRFQPNFETHLHCCPAWCLYRLFSLWNILYCRARTTNTVVDRLDSSNTVPSYAVNGSQHIPTVRFATFSSCELSWTRPGPRVVRPKTTCRLWTTV